MSPGTSHEHRNGAAEEDQRNDEHTDEIILVPGKLLYLQRAQTYLVRDPLRPK